MAGLREFIAELLSPTRCASCERPGALVCDRCLAAMERIDPVHACTRCGAPYGDMLCTECAETNEALGRCLAAAVFDGPPARLVRAYKDGGELRLAQVIAQLMASAAFQAEQTAQARYGGMVSAADFVTFVPATAAAFRRRGFDHMERIARVFSQMAGVPYLDALAKQGKLDQRDLSREERRSKSRDVYRVVVPSEVRGRRLLLLDDVITTGATVNAAAGALMRAGAAHVDALAFARVWG